MQTILRYLIGALCVLITAALGYYVSLTARGRGPILSDTTHLSGTQTGGKRKLSKKQRLADEQERRAEYRICTLTFGLMALFFLCLSLYLLVDWIWCLLIALPLILFDAAYVITVTLTGALKKKKGPRLKQHRP